MTSPSLRTSSEDVAAAPRSPFTFTLTSDAVAPFQHSGFRALELALPRTLWSPSFVQQRAQYTLTRTETEAPDVASSLSQRGPMSSLPPAHTCTWSLMHLHRQFVQAKYPHGIRFRCFPSAAPKGAPLISDHANRKRCRSGADSEGEEVSGNLSADACALSSSTDAHTDPGISTSRSSTYSGGSHPRESPILQDQRERKAQRRSPSPTSPVVSTANAFTTPGIVDVRAPILEVDEQEVARHAPRSPPLPPQPHEKADGVTSALRQALDVTQSILENVMARHQRDCPLCSPVRPPTWLNETRPSRLGRRRCVVGAHKANSSSAPGLTTGSSAPPSAEDLSCPLARRAALRRRIEQFLSQHKERQTQLLATRPTMYDSHGAGLQHPCLDGCRALGGVELLDALLIGL